MKNIEFRFKFVSKNIGKILIITKQFSTLNLGLKSKIIAPPATLTSEMGRNLSSAKSEVQMVSM